MPCAIGILSNSLSNSPYGFLANNFSNDCSEAEKENIQGYIGVPEGCVVRNTFLEWQEPAEEKIASGADLPATVERRPLETKRRARSCPREFMSWTSRSLTQEAQHGSEERDQPLGGEVTSKSEPATPANFDEAHERASPFEGAPFSPTDGNQQKAHKNRTVGASIVLRGLPFNVTEADVMDFIVQAGCAKAIAKNDPITLLSNQQGRPSGFAEIQLNRPNEFWEVQEKLHMQRLGTRYVEALPPRGKGAWGASPASRHTAKRDPWRRLKGQAAWHQSGTPSPEWNCYNY